ncbi:MAG: hypothetical protein QGG40_12395, partial [Myxococcota bacterium]|nr:hypothetical protein [Myxococcota bacterium]
MEARGIGVGVLLGCGILMGWARPGLGQDMGSSGSGDDVLEMNQDGRSVGAAAGINEPLGTNHRWRSLRFGAPARDVVYTLDGEILALNDMGAVLRSEPGGSWRVVLDPPDLGMEMGEEELLLDVEMSVEELSFGEDDYDELEADDTEGEVEASTDEVLDVALEDALDAGVLEADSREASAASEVATLWASALVDGLVLCSRGDGTWRTMDSGQSWSRVQGLPEVRRFAQVHPQVVMAATDQGLRHSVDQGISWIRIHDAVGDIPALDLVTDGQTLYAGTSAGLFRSSDGLRWQALGSADHEQELIQALAVDSAWDGGLWAAGSDSLLRSDDRGEQLRSASTLPLVGVRRILALEDAGHVLVAGEDGVWESTDGGIRWSPLVQGLPGPGVWELTPSDQGLLLAGQGGVYQLVSVERAETVTRTTVEEVAPALSEVLDVALRKSTISLDPVRIQRGISKSLRMPSVTLDASVDPQSSASADYLALGNDAERDLDWTVGASLCFGGCGRSAEVYQNWVSAYEEPDPDAV